MRMWWLHLGQTSRVFSSSGRYNTASQAVGIARAAYEATLQWSRDRKAFGQAIGSFQMTQAKIADMKCKLDAATLLTLRAAWTKAQTEKNGGRFGTEASVAKLVASEAAMWIAHQAVQIHGGMGYSKEMPLERYFRDAMKRFRPGIAPTLVVLALLPLLVFLGFSRFAGRGGQARGCGRSRPARSSDWS